MTGLLAAPSLLAACAPAQPASKPTEAANPAAPAATIAPAAAAKPTEAPKPAEKPAEAKPAAAAPTMAPAAAKPAAGGVTFIWGSSEFPLRMNPQYTTAIPSTKMYDNFYDMLTRRDPDLKLLPGLATEWKLLNDTTWQFKLRPNVKWHNGEPFTAEDVKFTVERTRDPEAKSIHSTVFKTVKEINIVDPLTINFVTTAPDALLPARLAHYGGYLMPAKYFAQVGAEKFDQQPIGTGPFKMTEYVKDDHVTFVANTEYWGGKPNIDTWIMRPLPEEASRVAALQKGDVHFIDRVPDDQMAVLANGANTQTFSVPLSGVFFIVLNTKAGPLQSKPLRQAMNAAIDRQSLSKDLYLGNSTLVTGPIPNGEFGSKPGLQPPAYEQAKARAWVAESGYKGDEIPFEVQPQDRTLGEAVTAMWKDVGINAQLVVIQPSVRAQKIAQAGSFQGGFTAGFVSTVSDPSGLMWRSAGPGGVLSPYFSNDEWTKLGTEAEVILDQDKRRANYERMAEIMMDELPWLVLFQQAQNHAAIKSLNWRPHPNYQMDFRKDNLSFKS